VIFPCYGLKVVVKKIKDVLKVVIYIFINVQLVYIFIFGLYSC